MRKKGASPRGACRMQRFFWRGIGGERIDVYLKQYKFNVRGE